MAKIDFRNKINWRRRFRSPPRVETERDILRIFESDRGRIVNSPAIRRLQQKTQVFPLERNAAVRTRLTHSLEVQQVGRYIAKEVLSRLKEQRLLEEYGLEELTGPFESVVEINVRQYYNIALYIRFNIMILCTYMEMSCHLLLLSESVFINTQQEIFCYLLANCLGYCTEFLYALVIVNCVIRVSTCTHIEYCRLTHEYKLCIKIVKLFN